MLNRAIRSVESVNDGLINLIIVEGKPDRHMGRNRARAYRVGSNPYVACLDDDDFLTGRLTEAVRVLDANPTVVGAYYDDERVDGEGRFISTGYTFGTGPWAPYKQLNSPPHHICVMRRTAVERVADELENFPVHDLRVLHALILTYGDLCHIPATRYAWVQHGSQHHKQVAGEGKLLRRSIDFVRPLVVAAHNRGQKQALEENILNKIIEINLR